MASSSELTTLQSTMVEFDIEHQTHQQFLRADLDHISFNQTKIYWIHVNLDEMDSLQSIAKKISLPERVIKLCLQIDSMPILIDSEETITLQIECLLNRNNHELGNATKFGMLTIYLTDRYCFTASTSQIPALIEFYHNYSQSLKYAKTPCFILFLILSNIVNDYAKQFFNFEMVVEKMDLQIRSTHKNSYDKVLQVKNKMMRVRRNALSIREILMRISGRNISVISESCRLSLTNLLNQTDIIFHEADSVRDMLNGLLNQIDNSLMQKMNETMRVLTAFAAIFLPLGLIAGIYGMNFHWIPELGWQYGYFWALGLMAVCGLGLFYIFKKKKWF